MTRLSQIIAVEQGVKSDAEKARERALAEFQRTPQLTGISRTYQPRREDGDALPPESTNVQVKADEIVDGYVASLTRLFDVAATVEGGNRQAAADVVVDGTPLLKDVPVTYLLFLEKRLAEFHGFLSRLPLLDPAEEWHADPASGCWRTDVVKTVRTKKIPRNHVAAEATKEHPAQVQVYMEDIPEGDWSTVKFSGGLPAARVKLLLARSAELQRAVKYARQEANATEISDRQAGDKVFGWLLAP